MMYLKGSRVGQVGEIRLNRANTRLTKRQKRLLREEGVLDKKNNVNQQKFGMVDVLKKYNLNSLQHEVIERWDEGNHLVLHGLAGTGKTFLSVYLALSDILDMQEQSKLYIVRSVVPTRDIGFLPGNVKEKAKVYEDPYRSICNELFSRGDAYDILKTKNIVEFLTTSYIGGITLKDCIVMVDEINNMTFHELDSIVTRLGRNTRIIFCGDYRQSDLGEKERSGLKDFLNILNRIDDFSHFEFGVEHIVRSKLVKDYIIAKSKLGYV